MAQKRVTFGGTALPILLLAPQLAITAIFFFWPAIQAVRQSMYRSDAFGFGERFVGWDNFTALFRSARYWESVQVTAVFAASVAIITLCVSLAFASAVDRMIRSRTTYSTLLIWPYAVAPAVAVAASAPAVRARRRGTVTGPVAATATVVAPAVASRRPRAAARAEALPPSLRAKGGTLRSRRGSPR